MSVHRKRSCECGATWEGLESSKCPRCSSFAAPAGSEVLSNAMRHAQTLTEFYAAMDFERLPPLVQTSITLLREVVRLKEALSRIHAYPVHSEPVGGAYAMQDIAHDTLYPPNDQAEPPATTRKAQKQ